mmetsp:Transcript_1259/g.3683  ORF Transcript_1259/g.3683 Transcript_1259/m.3683 type:complete len:247 (-) Transcript_1259:180-920(-)
MRAKRKRPLYGHYERKHKSQNCLVRALYKKRTRKHAQRSALPCQTRWVSRYSQLWPLPSSGLQSDRRIKCTGGSRIGQSAFHMKDEDQKSAESTAKATMAGSAQIGASDPSHEDPYTPTALINIPPRMWNTYVAKHRSPQAVTSQILRRGIKWRKPQIAIACASGTTKRSSTIRKFPPHPSPPTMLCNLVPYAQIMPLLKSPGNTSTMGITATAANAAAPAGRLHLFSHNSHLSCLPVTPKQNNGK